MKLLMKSINFYVLSGHLQKCVNIDSFLMSYSPASEKFSHRSLQCAKKSNASRASSFRAFSFHRHHYQTQEVLGAVRSVEYRLNIVGKKKMNERCPNKEESIGNYASSNKGVNV